MNDPWQPYDQQNYQQQGWGPGGKPKPHPIVPEPSFYGAALILASLVFLIAKRTKTKKTK